MSWVIFSETRARIPTIHKLVQASGTELNRYLSEFNCRNLFKEVHPSLGKIFQSVDICHFAVPQAIAAAPLHERLERHMRGVEVVPGVNSDGVAMDLVTNAPNVGGNDTNVHRAMVGVMPLHDH